MDIEKLFTDLKKAKDHHDEVFATQVRVEKQLIKEEVELLKKLAEPLFKTAETRIIHDEPALLIYKYAENGKTLISPYVYFSKDGKIKFEVYDEPAYRSFRKNAVIIDGWNVMEPEEFLTYKGLSFIFKFLNERSQELYEDAETFVKSNQARQNFIHNLKNIMK